MEISRIISDGRVFLFKRSKTKIKRIFQSNISLENPNSDIKLQAEKRLNRDLSE
jgi:hypothetical protein